MESQEHSAARSALRSVGVMESWDEIRMWRKERRGELITARTALAPEQRTSWSKRITALLEAGFAMPAGTVVGFCWPHRGEFDARFAVRR
jgi:5-formyltetrahydrofolate cyclo-ligase